MNNNDKNSFNNDPTKSNKIDKSTFYYTSTIVALVMTIPGVVTLVILRFYTDDLVLQLGITSFVFLISLILSIKVAKLLSARSPFK
ncbi:MAG: hypothetical protein H0X03_01635 [Nitrosopumilus sp.]|nr:hypothetical protein [Nitrosopumilus sp.]